MNKKEFTLMVIENKNLTDLEKETIINSLPETPAKDNWVWRIIFIGLVVIVLACIVCGTFIILDNPNDKKLEIPDYLKTIAATVVGAMVGLFVPSPVAQTEKSKT